MSRSLQRIKVKTAHGCKRWISLGIARISCKGGDLSIEKLPEYDNCRIVRVALKFADPRSEEKSNQGLIREILKNKKIPLYGGFF